MNRAIARKLVFAAILICLFTGLRIVHLPSDPPWDLSTSAGIFTDEHHNIYCVRNKILFGEWMMTKWNMYIFSPLWTILQYPILLLLGIGMWQIKVLAIILSFLTMILIYRSFREYFGYWYGILAVSLVGLNYILMMYNRLGLWENLIMFFMALTLFFWQRAVRTKRHVYFFLAGCAAFLVFVAKGMTAYFVVSFFLTLLLTQPSGGVKRAAWLKNLTFGVLGIIAAASVWYAAFYLPNTEQLELLRSNWTGRAIPRHPVMTLLTVTSPILLRFRFMPLTLLTCWFYGLQLLNRRRLSIDPVEMLILFWLAGAAAFPSILSYNPMRYFLPAVLPIILTSAIFIMRFVSPGPDGLERRAAPLRFCGFLFLYLSATFYYFVIPYTGIYLHEAARVLHIEGMNPWQRLVMSLFLGGGLTLLTGFFMSLGRTSGIIAVLRKPLAVVLIGAILAVNMNFYLRWASKPTYVIRDSSREVGKMLKPDAFILGQGVTPLVIENKIRCLTFPNMFDDGRKIFLDYPVTHLYLSHYANRINAYKKHYPLVMEYSEVIASYEIWGKEFHLFELNIPPEERERAFKYR
jgi:4-amino-4-deoxy-L-arabinose transferase-like glycosyltransferase